MRAGRLILLVMLAFTAACSDEGPVSGPGTMTATVVGPNGPEGAAVIVLLGEGLGEITGVGDTEVYFQRGLTATKVVLMNQTGGDLSFQVAVPDTTDLPAWVVEQVASPDDGIRDDVGEYSLEFNR